MLADAKSQDRSDRFDFGWRVKATVEYLEVVGDVDEAHALIEAVHETQRMWHEDLAQIPPIEPGQSVAHLISGQQQD